MTTFMNLMEIMMYGSDVLLIEEMMDAYILTLNFGCVVVVIAVVALCLLLASMQTTTVLVISDSHESTANAEEK